MFKLKTLAHRSPASSTLSFENMFCYRNRFVLLIFSLLCTIIVLTQPAVALTIPPQPASFSSSNSSSSASSSSPESLVMILPQVNGSNGKMASSVLQLETSFNKAVDVLTPGQQVINAVPDNGKFQIKF